VHSAGSDDWTFGTADGDVTASSVRAGFTGHEHDSELGLILDGKLDPYIGARLLWKASVNNDIDHEHELDPFIYAASEYEDRPEDREGFKRAIIEEARDLVRRGL
jgi:hypothetical protein